MKRQTKQIVAIAALSILIAVQAYFLTAETSEPQIVPAAVFNQPRTQSVDRTLKPDGQTEEAALVTEITFNRELDFACEDLWTPVFTVDRIYVSPTEQTARLILKRAFRKLENVYVAQAYDCDDNATELMTLMKKEALVEYREYPAALAVGWVGVQIDGPVEGLKFMPTDPDEYPLYHAMVILRVKGGKWLFIEPLTHQYVELTGPIYEGQVIVRVLYF
jgi:hypothetical protein